jgi:hypothetical protein
MYEQGLIGNEWRDRVSSESPYWLDHDYGRAWWANFKETAIEGEIPPELAELIDKKLDVFSNYHVEYHEGVMKKLAEIQIAKSQSTLSN